MKTNTHTLNNHCVVFDLDKTLITCNLPEKAVELHGKHSKFFHKIFQCVDYFTKNIPTGRLKRRFEYLIVFLIKKKIENADLSLLLESYTNNAVKKRFDRYKRLGVNVIIITASPDLFKNKLENFYDCVVMTSQTKFGLLIKDLQNNKEFLYLKISNFNKLHAIYSDSIKDFSVSAKKNFLVIKDTISKYEI